MTCNAILSIQPLLLMCICRLFSDSVLVDGGGRGGGGGGGGQVPETKVIQAIV